MFVGWGTLGRTDRRSAAITLANVGRLLAVGRWTAVPVAGSGTGGVDDG
jgi:hypothetical protein